MKFQPLLVLMLQQQEEFCCDTLTVSTSAHLRYFSPFLLYQLAESIYANQKQLALDC